MARELFIDVGNRRVKWVMVLDGTPDWPSRGHCAHHEFAASSWSDQNPQRAWLASVAPPAVTAALYQKLCAAALVVEQVTIDHAGGRVAAAYSELGVDRWLALQAVWPALEGGAVIADCGTALTMDIMDDQGVHRGGWITAGLAAACAGLAHSAPMLPVPQNASFSPAVQPAQDTPTQIARGLLLQQAAAIDSGWRAACRMTGRPLSLILTGGDAAAVQSVLEIPSLRDDDLVLKGLMAIAGYT